MSYITFAVLKYYLFVTYITYCYCYSIVRRIKGMLLERACAKVGVYDEDVVRLCDNEFDFALKWSSQAEMKQAIHGRRVYGQFGGIIEINISAHCSIYLFVYILFYCTLSLFWRK